MEVSMSFPSASKVPQMGVNVQSDDLQHYKIAIVKDSMIYPYLLRQPLIEKKIHPMKTPHNLESITILLEI